MNAKRHDYALKHVGHSSTGVLDRLFDFEQNSNDSARPYRSAYDMSYGNATRRRDPQSPMKTAVGSLNRLHVTALVTVGVLCLASALVTTPLPTAERLSVLGFPWSEDTSQDQDTRATDPTLSKDIPSIRDQAEHIDDKFIDTKAQWNGLLALPTNQLKVAEYYADKYGIDKAHIARIVELANQTGAEANINPLMILAIISHESNFQPWVRNKSGAEGLMQVMTQIHKQKFEMFGGTDTTFDPAVNIRVGTLILRECIAIKRSIKGGLRYYAGAENEAIDDGGFVDYIFKEVELLSEILAFKPKHLDIHFPIKR